MAERHNFVHNIPAAKALRKPQTPTESLLWNELRDRRFQGLKFRRQHAVRNFVLDFYCHELRLAVEVDGGVHESPAARLADSARQAELEAEGIRFFRVPAWKVEREIAAVLADLASAVEAIPLSGDARSRERGQG
jgi:very-short-patch-repair endonuclease